MKTFSKILGTFMNLFLQESAKAWIPKKSKRIQDTCFFEEAPRQADLKQKRIHRGALLCLVPLALSACGNDVRETLGLGKDAPDEFVVVSRPPLSVPPDFELRPPGSGAQAAAPTPESNAQKTLLGTTAAAPVVTAPSSKKKADTGATATFLNKAGVDQATPDIRQQLGENAAKPLPAAEAGSLYEEMIGKEKTDTVVDAKKETKRLIENKEEGKPVTEGDTPTAAPASKSVWDRLF